MGDDLLAARAFVQDAQTHLETLLGENRYDAALARAAIADIRKAAMPLKARAIMRSGQRALELLEAQASRPKMDGAYLALNKLVTQYRQGLEEVELATSLPSYIDIPGSTQDCEDFISAKDTLASVFKFSRNEQHKQALGFLSGLSVDSPDQETASPMIRPIEKDQTVTPQSAQTEKQSRVPSPTAFEDLMPSLTNCVLIAARRSDKTVSLGYTANDVLLPAHCAGRVEKKLQALGRFLVDNIMESRDIRLARGDSQSGQLLITAKTEAGVITIDLECKGRGISKVQRDAITGADAFIQVSCLESHNVTTLRVKVDAKASQSQFKAQYPIAQKESVL